jgi:hypothetical protein
MLAQATAYSVGAIMIIAGLNSFRAPAQPAQFFGLPHPAMSAPNPWQYVFAARNVYVGLLFIVLGCMCDTWTIGLMEFLGSLLGSFDIAITIKSGAKGAWVRHAFGTVILLAVGITLVFGANK